MSDDKINPEIKMENGDLVVADSKDNRMIWVAMNMWSDGDVLPASERERVTWYGRLGSGEYKVVDVVPKFKKDPNK